MRSSWPLWLIRLCQVGILLAAGIIIAGYFYGLLDPHWSDVPPRFR